MVVVSPLGPGATQTVAALRAGRDCVTSITHFDASRCRCQTAGQVDNDWLADDGTAGLHRASAMMIAAARELQAADRDFRPELVIIGTTSGGMSFGEQFYRAQIHRERRPERARWLANYLPHKPVVDALRACHYDAPAQIIANACASGTNAIGHAFELIRAGAHQRILCGGYDAISELVHVGFDSLQAATPEKIRPFDKQRSGLVLGEGAAVLALEEWDGARQRGAPVLAEVRGYGLSTDNYHLTQPHPSGIGPRQAMERALISARCSPADIDYINAHGTATTFNDATEGIAIAELFGNPTPPISSTKSMMGHALGGAGAIEAIISILAIRHALLPPNIHHNETDPAWPLNIIANRARAADLDCVMSNSFGFGGTNASIVFRKNSVEP
jgi:3-oxoacyl-[acyl-carrier-protein] synthase II